MANLATQNAIIYNMIRTIRGINPFHFLPGTIDPDGGLRPKKYLIEPDFVMSQETNSVPFVASINTTGNDPETKIAKLIMLYKF